MKQFLQDAQNFAVKKAKTDQQVKEIQHNFKDIYKLIVKLEKQNGKHVSNISK
tara:strand:+ start:759 stop:917 length:159 start_codon:yes stop_codon:yes gene_type:complete